MQVERDPGLAEESVQRPLFTSAPATGTTLLHRLLACVPGTRAPRLWELMWTARLQPRSYQQVRAAGEIAGGQRSSHQYTVKQLGLERDATASDWQ